VHISAKLHCLGLHPDRNFKFHLARKAILRIYIFVPTAVLHFSTFLLNPHFDLEPDYIARKPMKHRFQQYIVRTEKFSTFYARLEYISRRTILDSTHSNECAHTDRQTHKSETLYPPDVADIIPHSLESDYSRLHKATSMHD